MKKKFINKLLGSCLTATVLISSLSGCGNTVTNSTTSEETTKSSVAVESTVESTEVVGEEITEITYPIKTEEEITLTIAHVTNSNVSTNWGSLAETPFWEDYQERTGIKLESVELSKDAFKLMIAGGDLPDMVFCKSSELPDGFALSFEDGILVGLNEYMEYAPDLAKVLENDAYYRSSTTDTGKIIGGPSIRGNTATTGFLIRTDWLEEVGMDAPETPDELYDVLVAFRDKMGAEVPLSLTSAHLASYLTGRGLITSGFGLVCGQKYIKDGQVHYGYAEPEIKAVYEYLHKLYTEGLLDPEFQTIDANTEKANILSGRSGITTGTNGNIPAWLSAGKEYDAEFDLTGISSLVSASGETPAYTVATDYVDGMFLCITSACEYPEIAAQLINYGYTDEGQMFFNFGTEGETYEMVNGYPTYTDLVVNNPEGKNMMQVMTGYMRSATGGWAMCVRPEYYEQYSSLPQQQNALAAWGNADWEKYLCPSLTIAEEDLNEYNKLDSEITTYTGEMRVAYITGTKSLDDFETEYMATLKSLGVDRWLEIQQEAYEAYLEK